jgi:hypothetical protein
MSNRTVRFRVESNKKKSTFWYTLVSGNGNTTMTSKAKYSSEDAARRAARNQAKALGFAPLAIEFVNAVGETVIEPVTGLREEVRSVALTGPTTPVRPGKPIPQPSLRPALDRLNPQ